MANHFDKKIILKDEFCLYSFLYICSMIKIYLKVSLVILILLSINLQLAAQSDIEKELATLVEHPENYDSYKRVKVFQNYASQYYKVSLDSVLGAYQKMESFGRRIDDSLVIAMALSSSGAIHKMQGENVQTFNLIQKASKYFRAYPEEALKNYAAIATEASALGKYDIALANIDRAFEQHEIVNSLANLSELYIVKGAYYEKQGQYYSALTEYQKSLEYKEYVASPLKVGNIYLNISQMYYYLHDVDKAFEYLLPVDDIIKENGYTMLANTLDLKRAAYYMKERQFEKSELYYLSAVKYLQDKKMDLKLLNVYSNLSIIKTETDEVKAAKDYLDLATKKLNIEVPESKMSAYYNAQYRYAQSIGEFAKSKAPLLKILAISEENNNPNRAFVAFDGLIKLFEFEKNWKQVAYYQGKLIQSTKDQNIENQKTLLYDLENKYQNEQKVLSIKSLQKDNQLKELELSQGKMENRLYIALLVLALLAFIGLRYSYTSIQKANRKLSDSNNQLSKALDVNKLLLKEIHHRVKNNLQVISSLLGLQQAYLKNPEAKEAIMTSKTRVQSMSLLHQKLYQGEDILKVNIKDYFENLILNLFQTYKVNQDKIELKQEIQSLELHVDTVITMGLIFNELISNALKYAFENDEKGVIKVSVKQVNNLIYMVVSDNGKGTEFNVLPKRSSSLGMNLVSSFTAKLEGEVVIDNCNGTHFEIAFPMQQKSA